MINNIKIGTRNNSSYDYGVFMLYINELDIFNTLRNSIKIEDVIKYEYHNHITILYGVDDKVLNNIYNDIYTFVRMISDKYENIKFMFDKISLFENDDFDVIKIDINSEDLIVVNKLIKDNFNYKNNHPIYHPHFTLAYVKSGEGKKYLKLLNDILDKSFINAHPFNSNIIEYGSTSGLKYIYEIN